MTQFFATLHTDAGMILMLFCSYEQFLQQVSKSEDPDQCIINNWIYLVVILLVPVVISSKILQNKDGM